MLAYGRGTPKSIYLFRCLKETLIVSKFKVAFSARPNPDESNGKFEDTEYPVRVLSVEDSRGRFVLIPKF